MSDHRARLNAALVANAFRTDGLPKRTVEVAVNDLVALLHDTAPPAPVQTVSTRRRRPPAVYPKCTCGHSARSHNELGYCQAGSGTMRECACENFDDGKRRQPDGSFA